MTYKAGDIIPGLGRVPDDVYEVQEGVCSMCGKVGYVLAGMRLTFTDESVKAFFDKYQRQKPVRCQAQGCSRVYCQKCATEKGRGRCVACGGGLNYL